ncbi:pyridine nucleotide-disulfide oxidoreductase [Candidatus Uabimicrobium amorphum]|uniref:Pyridine nucleotide-disulfide oxidoreductase n=2 Tax=Uabimicrobium amorphum TaxID=2596890 RepID=A0A5S9ILX1_UABAM|nr:FAD/NAD(P)-binding oxidoreductase [Candidatus Uabimicrobium amorphum]BBM84313.1 pyridine nucleotide-disulfide oxidoreductase [Candidatus Uabimicrobium amorphum]
MESYDIVIVGGGSAGITAAAHLSNEVASKSVAIIEPSTKHYYQPIWTLVGGGVFPKEVSEREQEDFIPDGYTWIQDKVATFDPKNNQIKTHDEKTIAYKYLIVAAGIQIDWDKIPGLKETVGTKGVCSNYSYETVDSTWENVKNFQGGTAIFTHPSTPIKCAGAPQKICYLAEDYFRKSGVRDKSNVVFASATAGIFGIEKYAKSLKKVVKRKNINTLFQHDLVELHPDKMEAVFKKLDDDERVTLSYDMIHVSPPMSAPKFIKDSELGNQDGWVDVDKHTLQHTKFKNVFSLGDCSSLPTSKTGAAIRKQAPVLVENLLAEMKGEKLKGHYDGYTSCPLVTGYGSLILAEFDYDKQPAETFPFDQGQERYSMYALKAYGLPRMYWHGMLKGRV